MTLLVSLSFVTMTLFCLAMDKHRKQIVSRKFPRFVSSLLRPLAWLMLILNLYLSVDLYGWSIGPVVFFGGLSSCLLPLIILLTYRAAIIPMLAITLPIISYINY